MNSGQPVILFVDNSVARIYKTLETVKSTYKCVQVFNNEKEFLDYLGSSNADVIFLNLDLEPNDAVTLLKEIRSRSQNPPPFIVIYSEKSDDFVQELAFNSGVDSFISFHNKPAVISLFLRNLLRRRVKAGQNTSKDLVIDRDRFLIFKNGVAFQLPRKEFRLFELLYNNSEKFFSKAEIASHIWHDEKVASKRTIDVHIYNIRQFFGKRIIQSQKGKGYRINRKLVG